MNSDNTSASFKGNKEDQGELKRIYEAYQEQLYRFILLRVSHEEIASDISQEVFHNLLQATRGKEREIENIRGFLYQIARNLVIDHYRSNVVTYPLEVEGEDGEFTRQIPYEGPGADTLLDQEYTAEEIRKALSAVKKQHREIVEMRYLQQLEMSEIAEKLGKSEGAIRVQIHRAIGELRDYFSAKK